MVIKKSLIPVLFFGLVLALSFVSAGFFSDIYSGMTGNAISGGYYTCSDTDANSAHLNGDNKFINGTTTRTVHYGTPPPSMTKTGTNLIIPDEQLVVPQIEPDSDLLINKGEITTPVTKQGFFSKIKTFLSGQKISQKTTQVTVKTSTIKITNPTGMVTSGINSKTDYCFSGGTKLLEYYCGEDNTIKNKTYTCACSNKKCVDEEEEGGFKSAEGSFEAVPAGDPYEGLACAPLKETDRDLNHLDGKNYLHSGRIKNWSNDIVVPGDQCLADGVTLREYFCPASTDSVGYVDVPCIYGCYDPILGGNNAHCKSCEDSDSLLYFDSADFGVNEFGLLGPGTVRFTQDGITEKNGGIIFPKIDICSVGDNVTEFYCKYDSSSQEHVRASKNITCENSCVLGTCSLIAGSTDVQLKSPATNSVTGKYFNDFVCELGLSGTGASNATIYVWYNNGSLKESYSLSALSGMPPKVYSCGINKCFNFTIPKYQTDPPQLPQYEDGIYKWSCSAYVYSAEHWASENRTIYFANGTLLVYDGNMITPNWTAVEDVPGTTPKSISQFDSFFKLYINGSLANNAGIVYSVYSSPNVDVLFNSRTSVNITPKANFNGHAEITFLATNGSKSVQMKPLGVDVSNMPDPPVVVSNLIQWRVNNSTLVDLNSFFTNPESGSMYYNWTGAENITITNSSYNILNFSSSPNFVGYKYINITAKNSVGSTTANFTLKVSDSNHAPVINSYSPNSSALTAALNEKIAFTVSASDPDDDDLTYYWPVYKSNGVFVTSSPNQSFTFSSSTPGSFTVKIVISDGEFLAEKSWTLVVGSGDDEPENNLCGNGKIDTGEVCDGDLLNGATCQNQGYDSGEIGCSSNCKTYDKTLCVLENTYEEPPEEPEGDTDSSKIGTYLIWGLIIILLILIIVGAILIIRIIKKRNAAKATTQTWQAKPSSGTNFQAR